MWQLFSLRLELIPPRGGVSHNLATHLKQRCTTFFDQGPQCILLVHSGAEKKLLAELSRVEYRKPIYLFN